MEDGDRHRGVASPSLLTCAYVDVLWRVAEAFANTDRMPRATDTYVYILTNCDDPQERVATLQKAIDVLPDDELPSLLALGRDDEFATVNDLLLRRRVSVTSRGPEPRLEPIEDLTRIEARSPRMATPPTRCCSAGTIIATGRPDRRSTGSTRRASATRRAPRPSRATRCR